jgi:hypothetical protein
LPATGVDSIGHDDGSGKVEEEKGTWRQVEGEEAAAVAARFAELTPVMAEITIKIYGWRPGESEINFGTTDGRSELAGVSHAEAAQRIRHVALRELDTALKIFAAAQ